MAAVLLPQAGAHRNAPNNSPVGALPRVQAAPHRDQVAHQAPPPEARPPAPPHAASPRRRRHEADVDNPHPRNHVAPKRHRDGPPSHCETCKARKPNCHRRTGSPPVEMNRGARWNRRTLFRPV